MYNYKIHNADLCIFSLSSAPASKLYAPLQHTTLVYSLYWCTNNQNSPLMHANAVMVDPDRVGEIQHSVHTIKMCMFWMVFAKVISLNRKQVDLHTVWHYHKIRCTCIGTIQQMWCRLRGKILIRGTFWSHILLTACMSYWYVMWL